MKMSDFLPVEPSIHGLLEHNVYNHRGGRKLFWGACCQATLLGNHCEMKRTIVVMTLMNHALLMHLVETMV